MMVRLAAMASCVFAVLAMPLSLAAAERPLTLSADDAFAKAKAGEVVLIDVRTPEEWARFGVGEAAQPITKHQPEADFVTQVEAALQGDRRRPVALICATGRRSAQMQAVLDRLGFETVYNVVEGMFGREGVGPGWYQRNLPLSYGPEN